MTQLPSQPKTDITLPSLFDFVERNISQAEVYDTRRICSVVKHTFESDIEIYRKLVEKANKDQSPEALANANSYGEKIKENGKIILDTLKRGAEIDVMLSTKFDSLQVIALLQQLPPEIIAVVEDALTAILDDIVNYVELNLSQSETDGKSKKTILSHKFLRPTRTFAIAEIVSQIATELSRRLDELAVPITSQTASEATVVSGVEEEVIEMRLSVPVSPEEPQRQLTAQSLQEEKEGEEEEEIKEEA